MSFRTRLFIAFFVAGIIPFLILVFVVRNEMTTQLTDQHIAQVAERIQLIEENLDREKTRIETLLNNMAAQIPEDNRLRSALIDRSSIDRRYLLDYASSQMRSAGLSMLQLQDEAGRILSSGHFRNEYDRMEGQLLALFNQHEQLSSALLIIAARTPEGPIRALVRVDSFLIGGSSYYLVGGLALDNSYFAAMSRSEEMRVHVYFPNEPDSLVNRERHTSITQEIAIPFVGSERETMELARVEVTHSQAELIALQASIDRWFLIVGVTLGALAVGMLLWMSSHVSRPIRALADKTAKLDLEKLDVNFQTDRKDEIGMLSTVLGNMTQRIRKSAVEVKDAERRAAIGDIARQVNHDIKNGLTPIRNVFRHLLQLASSSPERMPLVFNERKDTIDSSLNYLQDLAGNYARLTKGRDKTACDLSAIVRRLVRDAQSLQRADVRMRVSGKSVVRADVLSLQRIVNNLLGNAIDSLENGPGHVVVSTNAWQREDGRDMVRLKVEDTGVGMMEEQKKHIFQDFYTTKEKGTGLGLSVVRRLVMDLDGSIRVESETGKGTTFIVDLPAS